MSPRRAYRRLEGQLPETGLVHDMTIEGHGIADVGGRRVFVERAITGESVTYHRQRTKRNYDEAALLAVESPSPERVPPRCPHFGTCGGCSLQHLAPVAQPRLKQQALLDSLARIGRVQPAQVLDPVTGEGWGYRRRARLAARYVEGKARVLVGFSERDSSRIADMRRCETLHATLADLPGDLSDLLGALSLSRRIPQVEVIVGDDATALIFRVLDDPPATDRASLAAFGARHGMRVLLQRGGPDVLEYPDGTLARDDFCYELPGPDLRLSFGPTDFIQVNAEVNRKLVALALSLLAPDRSARVLDLYCGIGNFTLPLARAAGFALGVEGAAAMVARASANARLNDIANAAFRVADLGVSEGSAAFAGERFDAVLLDPPRVGAAAMCRPVAATGARRVLYVSCHPGTLARDAGTLVHELGFRLQAAGVLDMFPHTSHVESVALFER